MAVCVLQATLYNLLSRLCFVTEQEGVDEVLANYILNALVEVWAPLI